MTASQELPGNALYGLHAKQAITDAIYLYCRATDRIDAPAAARLWHAGGTVDYPAIYNGDAAVFVAWATDYHRSIEFHSHQVSNILITVEDDHAASEAYVTVIARFIEDGKLYESNNHGRYLDRWSFRDGRWALDHRHYVHDFDDVREITQQRMANTGRRDPQDASYQYLPAAGAPVKD